MSEKEQQGLEPEELDKQNGEPLPDREAMSVISVPGAEPVDPGYTQPVEPDPGYTQPVEPPATE